MGTFCRIALSYSAPRALSRAARRPISATRRASARDSASTRSSSKSRSIWVHCESSESAGDSRTNEYWAKSATKES
eukprot:5452088-Pyramimonas_sp.AAC.1